MATRGGEFPKYPRETISEIDRTVLLNFQEHSRLIPQWLEKEAKPIYFELIGLQEAGSSTENIEEVKSKLLLSMLGSNITEFETDFDTPGLKEKLASYFEKQNLDLNHLASTLQHDIVNLCVKPLPKNKEQNAFRIVVRKENMYKIDTIIKNFLEASDIK